MVHLLIPRNSLVHVLGGGLRKPGVEELVSGPPLGRPPSRSVIVCWNFPPSEAHDLPGLLIVPDGELDAFFAWSTTFIPQLRPLTAFVRVVTWETFVVYNNAREKWTGMGPMIVGTVLGELLMSASESQGVLDTIPVIRMESTLSAVLGQLALRGFISPALIHTVTSNWLLARQITRSPKRFEDDLVTNVWSVIMHLEGQPSMYVPTNARLIPVLKACSLLQRGLPIESQLWQSMGGGTIPFEAQLSALKQSKESRVEVFETFTSSLLAEAGDPIVTDFFVGYLASLVSGGSLEHSHLIHHIAQRPAAMLWYGVCSGLRPDTKLLSDYGHLGLRFLRRINRESDLLAEPSCDISIDELKILVRGENGTHIFRQTTSFHLRVELAPTVTGVVRWSGRPESQAASQLDLFAERELETTSPINDLVRLLNDGLKIAKGLVDSKTAPIKPGFRARRRKNH